MEREERIGWIVLICILVFLLVWLVNPEIVGRIIGVMFPTTTTTSIITTSTTTTIPNPVALGELETFGIHAVTADGVYVILKSKTENKNEQGIVISHNTSGVVIPITFQTDVKDVYLSLKCEVPSYVLSDFMREIDWSKEGGKAYVFETYEPAPYKVDGYAYLKCEHFGYASCTGNGKYENTRISAWEGINATAIYGFSLFENEETFELNCEAGIVSSKPQQKVRVPFSIRYVYD